MAGDLVELHPPPPTSPTMSSISTSPSGGGGGHGGSYTAGALMAAMQTSSTTTTPIVVAITANECRQQLRTQMIGSIVLTRKFRFLHLPIVVISLLASSCRCHLGIVSVVANTVTRKAIGTSNFLIIPMFQLRRGGPEYSGTLALFWIWCSISIQR